MTAAARSSSSAPSRSEQRTWSTSHRPGATCASEVTRGAGDEGASGGGVAGAGGGATCCCEAGDCAHAASQQANRTATNLVFIIVPLSNHVALWLGLTVRFKRLGTPDEPVAVLRQAITASITCARTARRSTAYCTAESAEPAPIAAPR